MRRNWAWVVLVLGLALSGEAAMLPMDMDMPVVPKGFAGTWVEDWPGVRDHDVSVVAFQNGVWSVQVTNAQAGPYKVDNVRLEDDVLKFTENAGKTSLQYEVRVTDADTLAVTVKGGPAAKGPIVWRRQGEPPMGLVGTWVEDWPGVSDHDTSIVGFQNGIWSVKVIHPKAGPYKVERVRLEGTVLKFTEYPGRNAIDYEVSLKDPNTCAVSVKGEPVPKGLVVWRRQGKQAP